MSSGPTVPSWLGHHAATAPDRPALIEDGERWEDWYRASNPKLSGTGTFLEGLVSLCGNCLVSDRDQALHPPTKPPRWSFSELEARAGSLAARLAGLGVCAGDHVGALLGNGPEYVTLVHALISLGAVLVPLNTRLAAPEIGWQLEDAQVRLLVHDEPNATKAVAAASTETLLASADDLLSGGGHGVGDYLRRPIDLSALHSIIYTSGTTGRPKGAMLTYGNHWWSAVGSAINLGHHRDDRWLLCLPMYHVGGLAIVMRCAIYGVPAIVHGSFDAAAVNRAIDEEGVTLVSVVSAMLRQMLEERGGRTYPRGLRCILLGGGPAPRPLLEECAQRQVPVLQTYGLTETASQAATLSPEDALSRLGSAGKPLMPVEVRVEHDGAEGAPEQPGEILVRGPNVTPGYWRRPEETARAFRDGWLRTGDIGYLDSEGYLYVLDRRDDLIVSGGENVYPAEVEAVLMSHPAVEDAGVVGVPDARWGETVAARVKLKPGQEVGTEALAAYCRQHLAGYKAPARIELVDALPRNAAGKLQRRLLRK